MEDATYLKIVGKSSGRSTLATVPISDPSTIATVLQFNWNAQRSTTSGFVIGGGSKIWESGLGSAVPMSKSKLRGSSRWLRTLCKAGETPECFILAEEMF
jgi:hypothetical protein